MDFKNKLDESSESHDARGSSSLFTGSESDYSTYNCKYCLYGTNLLEALRRHERAHLVPGPTVKKELKPLHCCEFCNTKFVQKKELDDHRKKHAIGMVCALCSYTSPNKNSLKNHVRAHNNKKSFQCLLCCERMTSRKMFDDHMNKHVLTLSSCKWCRFTTDTPSRLKAHFQIHMKTKQIECKKCNYICFVEADMKEHKTLHDDVDETQSESIYNVSSAGKEDTSETTPFEVRGFSATPASDETSDPFVNTNLKRMLKRAFYKCSICGEVMKTDEALQRHTYKHISTQQYSCHICHFSGKNRDDIINHVMDHLPVVDLSRVGK